ncbi:MAG: PLP-dependent aminotransferase family protein [Eubacteriales bacterium]|nr:PLP-dependent aminotransferase family protein [Eubacteriales bacterium]
MLTYNFENVDGPLYEYVYKCIKEDILEGNLSTGIKLPSKRSFAKNNGVSTITIQNAYDQLISEGYIYAIPKKGYYVADITDFKKVKRPEKASMDIKVPVREEIVFDFSSNKIEVDNFPFSIWARLMRDTISNREGELLEISPCGGVYELREAIAEHLSSFRGMSVDPNQIIVGAGTEYLYGLLIKLLGKDKIYCIENPGYKKLYAIYKSNDVCCKSAGLDEQGVVVDDLRKVKADIAHISPTHHFPTGITMPVNRRYELLAWANEKESRYIIEDDYDSEFRLNGKPIPPLQSIDACEKVIYMNTFSKSLASTIRISYMVLPRHLANRYYEQLSFYSCTVSTFEQYTLASFIKKGYFEKHINRMRLHYGRKRTQILQTIRNIFSNNECEILENDSGLHFLLQFNTKVSDEYVKEKLWEKKIKIVTVADFDTEKKKQNKHQFILNYSNMNPDELENALKYLKKII